MLFKYICIFIGLIKLSESVHLSMPQIDNADPSTDNNLLDEINLLKKQLNILMVRRRDDYKMIENSIKKSIKKNISQYLDTNIRNEVIQLRHEIKELKEGKNTTDREISAATVSIENQKLNQNNNNNNNNNKKEQITIDWLIKTISELRNELSELQEKSINNINEDLQLRKQMNDDVKIITDDWKYIKLEIKSINNRQDNIEFSIKELQNEAIQHDDDLRHNYNLHGQIRVKSEADHKMRHHRYLRQQVHDLDVIQKTIQQRLNDLNPYKIDERLHKLENEQRHLANANFNLSREIVGLDKLHSSMLELLEDIENIQNKMDKTIPDIRREISKNEFQTAQLLSEQNLLREEGHNIAKSVQAVAVSVSTLQEDRDDTKLLKNKFINMEENFNKIKLTAKHGDFLTKLYEKYEKEAKLNATLLNINQIEQNQSQVEVASNNIITTQLFTQLENVEEQYETIINKLPHDCSDIKTKNTSGLYLIAPIGQKRPILTKCDNEWTTIQRRFDGSVDFNRSWNDYSVGFGIPSSEFWIGNDIIHKLTKNKCNKLKILMEDIYDNIWLAEYNEFYLTNKSDGYRLYISDYTGNASDALSYQNNMKFSSVDIDNDISNTNCAENYEGGWWFSHCQHANLNGRYNLGLTWFDSSRNEWIAVKSSHMMITKKDQCNHTLSTINTTTTASTLIN